MAPTITRTPGSSTALQAWIAGREIALAEVRRLWVMQCAYDAIDPGAPFVVFSPSNPYTPLYNTAMGAWVARV